MKKGSGYYSAQTSEVLKKSGIFIPIVLVLYGVLVHFKIFYSEQYVSPYIFVFLLLGWVAIAFWQYIPSKAENLNRDVAIRLALYHLLAACYVLLVSGFVAPILMCWSLLFIVAYLRFGQRALIFSILSLAVVLIASSVLYRQAISEQLVSVVAVAATVSFGLALCYIIRSLQIDSSVLIKTQKRESLEHDRIVTIVNNLADAILSTDKEGVIRLYNAASLNLLDTNDSLNGHHIDELLNLIDTSGKQFNIYHAMQKARGVVTRDDIIYTIAGDETIRLEVTFSPIRSNFSRHKRSEVHDGYILILRDITKPKSLEEERDEFISVVSHELRTPLTVAEGALGNVDFMIEHGKAPINKVRSAVSLAHEQIIYLSKLVNDLSTLSRAERGVADTVEDVDVRVLVEELYNEYRPEAEAKGLHLNLDLAGSPGKVSASPLYLKELLQNFITNAIKYTKKGQVDFIVDTTKSPNGLITFTIRDTGIGISKADQKHIFEKFYRSEDYRTRETGGTGLGLYVAAKLARKIGCKIELSSRLNHGSTFSFSLPRIK